MTLSTEALIAAKDTVNALLEELGLEAYLFEVQPADDGWEVKVECAIADGWQSTRLTLARERLDACQKDAAGRRALQGEWGERLAACRRV